MSLTCDRLTNPEGPEREAYSQDALRGPNLKCGPSRILALWNAFNLGIGGRKGHMR